MSYARFGQEGSDVYVILSTERRLECYACSLALVDEGQRCHFPSTQCRTTEAMVEHLHGHQEAGHVVPLSTFEGLAADAEVNDPIMAGWRGQADE